MSEKYPYRRLLPEIAQMMGEKRKVIMMVQEVHDELAKRCFKKYGFDGSLGFLFSEFETLVAVIDRERVSISAVEEYCRRFKEITPIDVYKRCYEGTTMWAENGGEEMPATRKFDWAMDPLRPFWPVWIEYALPEVGQQPSGSPVDRAPVWHPTMGRFYIRDIYEVLLSRCNSKEGPNDYHVVFEPKSITPPKDWIINPERVPRALLKISTFKTDAVMVQKNSQGWEYVILESVDESRGGCCR